MRRSIFLEPNMKIETMHFQDVGPLGNERIDLSDSWTGEIAPRILFSGPNGTGKSIALRTFAMLWEAAGYWLDRAKVMPKSEPARGWLAQWGGCAAILNEVFEGSGAVGLVFGNAEWIETLREKYSDISWIGESVRASGTGRSVSFHFVNAPADSCFAEWAERRRKLILTFEPADLPNAIYLDAEERRWVTPKRGVGKLEPEDPRLRWLVRYRATEDWQGQLEASLVALKTSKLHLFHETIRLLNRFLHDKEIETDVRTGENRLRIKLKNRRGRTHFLDDLSSGEHQVLIQLYLIQRWLEPGGIVLIDEPDLHLHPSLISGFLAALESLAEKRNGQLILTSHAPKIWDRYESTGHRIVLGNTP
jgi:hypothetical protein